MLVGFATEAPEEVDFSSPAGYDSQVRSRKEMQPAGRKSSEPNNGADFLRSGPLSPDVTESGPTEFYENSEIDTASSVA